MGIKYLNYKSIPRARRRAVAAQKTARLKESMLLAVTPEQQQAVQNEITKLKGWVDGTLPISKPPGLEKKADKKAKRVDVEVVVKEEIVADEGVGKKGK